MQMLQNPTKINKPTLQIKGYKYLDTLVFIPKSQQKTTINHPPSLTMAGYVLVTKGHRHHTKKVFHPEFS